MLNHKLLIKIAINSALGVILIFIWSRFVNISELFTVLKTVEIKYAAVFFGLFFLSGNLRSLRFKLLLKKYHLPFKDVLMLNFLSQFLSFMIPIRAGELTKSVYLTSQFDLSLGKTIIWVFVDRFLDFWAMLLIIALMLLLVPTTLPDSVVKIIFVLLFILSLMFIVALKSEWFLKKMVSFVSPLLIFSNIKRWFVTFTHTIIEGFDVLRVNTAKNQDGRSFSELLTLIFLTIIAAIVDSFVWVVLFLSFGVRLDFFKGLLGNSLAALSFIIPSAPGYVGSAEAATLAVFSGILGLPTNLVPAVSILFHILTMIVILVLGISSLYLLKFDLGLVWKRLRKE